MEHLFHSLLQDCEESAPDQQNPCDGGSAGETPCIDSDVNVESSSYKENLYVSKKLFVKISKYLEKEPGVLRCDEVWEEGWFNKKESYIRKRLKHRRNEGRYFLGISHLCRSFNGKRITRYQLFWLYERDVYYINKGLDLEPSSEVVPVDTLPNLYNIINIDKPEEQKKG